MSCPILAAPGESIEEHMGDTASELTHDDVINNLAKAADSSAELVTEQMADLMKTENSGSAMEDAADTLNADIKDETGSDSDTVNIRFSKVEPSKQEYTDVTAQQSMEQEIQECQAALDQDLDEAEPQVKSEAEPQVPVQSEAAYVAKDTCTRHNVQEELDAKRQKNSDLQQRVQHAAAAFECPQSEEELNLMVDNLEHQHDPDWHQKSRMFHNEASARVFQKSESVTQQLE